jgi:pimeloyl-ACP methyl ester carboxylesterase
LELFVDDAVELLAHLGLDRAVIWGESAGAPIAATFALQHPERTAALVLTDAAPWFSRNPELIGRLKERVHLLETAGPEAAYAARRDGGPVGPNFFSSHRPPASDSEAQQLELTRARFRARLLAVSRAERVRMYAAELRTSSAYADFDVTASFDRLKMPVLIVYGPADAIFPSAGWGELTAALPNVEYVPLEGAGHGCGRTPEGISVVSDFLDRVVLGRPE